MPPFLLFLWCIACAGASAHADIIVLQSDGKPSIAGVVQAIQANAGTRVEVFNLNGERARAAEAVAAIQASPTQQVAAVGLLAAQVARQQLSSKQVVFSQVLNYGDFDLTASWMKGVSAIPSMQKQFRTWKTLDPNLKRVGVITGRQMRDAVEQADAAARANGIELVHIEVGSDREVMPSLRQLTGRVQGLWLAPDSSVLSTNVIREMISHASRQEIQILAFSSALLREGALLSGTPDNAETARAVLLRLKQAQSAQGVPGDNVVPLPSANITINGKLAERLGLNLSDKVREMAHVE